jgi:hypothetical protein
MLIILWIYNVILFTFLSDWYFNDDITWEEESGDHICRSMISCYVTTLNFGLRNGGGIGDTLGSVSYFNEAREVFFLRAFNDLSYMIIIVLLSFNIIFGIIIDTFGGLREEAAAMDDDMRNVCYICGIDRATVSQILLLTDFISSTKTLRMATCSTLNRSTTCGSTCSS